MVVVFREVWRVLKPTGTVWMNLGDSYSGGGGAHKPEHANPGLSKSAERNGVPTSERDIISGLKPKDLVGMPWRVAFALQADGWYLRSDIIWSKPNPMPESVSDRPTKAHEYVFLLTKSPRYYYDADAIRESNGNEANWDNYGGKGLHDHKDDLVKGMSQPKVMPNATHPNGRNKRTVWEIATQPYPEAHFATYPEKLVEPCIMAGTSEKGNCAECGKPWERIVEASGGTIGEGWHDHTDDLARGMRDNSSGKSTDGTYKREHKGWQPTCSCNAEVVPATVLDPFAGSGTTLAVAQRLGRKSIGTDLSEEYLKLASKRLGAIAMPMILF